MACREAIEGTPLEPVLGRLPPGLALEARRGLGALLDEEEGVPRPPEGKGRGRPRRRSDGGAESQPVAERLARGATLVGRG